MVDRTTTLPIGIPVLHREASAASTAVLHYEALPRKPY